MELRTSSASLTALPHSSLTELPLNCLSDIKTDNLGFSSDGKLNAPVLLTGNVDNESGGSSGLSESEICETKEEYSKSDGHDYKKANCVSSSPSMPLPILRYLMWEHHSSRDRSVDRSVIQTDVPPS